MKLSEDAHAEVHNEGRLRPQFKNDEGNSCVPNGSNKDAPAGSGDDADDAPATEVPQAGVPATYAYIASNRGVSTTSAGSSNGSNRSASTLSAGNRSASVWGSQE
jgi:hypothetical protein